jgi:PIN domain nuclease of toxin-antitoxin system
MLLLDSNMIIFLLRDAASIPLQTQDIIRRQPDSLLVSIASVWEIEIKRGLGKLDLGGFDWHMPKLAERFTILDITIDDAVRASRLPLLHRDPFDRMIIAQALNRNAIVVTRDVVFRRYSVAMIEG